MIISAIDLISFIDPPDFYASICGRCYLFFFFGLVLSPYHTDLYLAFPALEMFNNREAEFAFKKGQGKFLLEQPRPNTNSFIIELCFSILVLNR